jgi:hypothetical protein
MSPKEEKSTPITYVQVTEQKRLNEAREKGIPWKKWGPYLSERQWGTVREDYSDDGNAWDYFSHDQARSRAYRWGEDGLAGYCDDKKFQDDPHWKDYILFYEYFHGENGAGLGTSHQTGWTGLIARALDLFARLKAEDILSATKGSIASKLTREQVAGQ